MGDACLPKNLAAITKAHAQLDGGDFFTEAEIKAHLDTKANYYYENVIAKKLGQHPSKPKKASVLDVYKGVRQRSAANIKNAKGLAKVSTALGESDKALWGPVDQILPEKFWGPIDKQITAFSQGKDTSFKQYNEMVAKKARNLIGKIDEIFENNRTKGARNRALAKYGLNTDNIYDAKDWLNWLAEGGHMKQGVSDRVEVVPGVEWTNVGKVSASVSKSLANLNVGWTLYNIADTMRILTSFSTRPGVIVKAFAKGTMELKGNWFAETPRMQKMGLYDTARPEMGESFLGKFEPFGASVRLQKNLAFFLSEAAGINPVKGISELVFDQKPWMVPRVFRLASGSDARLVYGLARYPIQEARWLTKTMGKIMTGQEAPREMANLTTWAISRAILFGPVAIIPNFISMSDEQKELLREVEDTYNLNLVRQISRYGLTAIGLDNEVDIGGSLRPFGGTLGSNFDIVLGTMFDIPEHVLKAAEDTANGKPSAAGYRAIALLSTVGSMFGFYGGMQKISPFSSAQIRKWAQAHAKGIEEDWSEERIDREAMKAFAGGRNIKKVEDNQGGSNKVVRMKVKRAKPKRIKPERAQ